MANWGNHEREIVIRLAT